MSAPHASASKRCAADLYFASSFGAAARAIEAGPCDYSLNMEYDEDACFKAIQWLHRRTGEPDKRPFALTVSFMGGVCGAGGRLIHGC